jgi:glycerol-3-phosphate acyltransferase PlsY
MRWTFWTEAEFHPTIKLMDHAVVVVTLLAAYLVGAIPFGYLVARARGVDIFAHGSGNIGATNVGRVLGRRLGILVFVLDCLKGAGPVAAALAVKTTLSDSYWTAGWLEVAAGLAAFLGHLFPVYLRFRGGKGVATGTGVVLVLMPIPTLAAAFAWVLVASASRYVSLASLGAAAVLCLGQLALSDNDVTNPRTAFCLLAVALVIVKHRSNVKRLWQGTENRIGENVAMTQMQRSLHVLALGLWFGLAIGFSFVVALNLFNTFETLGQQGQRPAWFPLPAEFAKSDEAVNGPKEQGARVAGAAVGPIFPWYFAIQGICGLIALATALAWSRLGRVHRLRVWLLFVALAGVLIGWPVEQKVSELRVPRNEALDAYLRAAPSEAEAARLTLVEARREFGRWHTYSLLLNMATILAVTAALALAGNLPARAAQSSTSV